MLFPPTLQWLLSPRVTDPLANLLTWQLGPVLGFAAILGLGVLALAGIRTVAAARSKTSALPDDRIVELTGQVMLLAFVAVVVLYMTTRFQHMGRYLLPVVPLLAVAAGTAAPPHSAARLVRHSQAARPCSGSPRSTRSRSRRSTARR